MEAQPGGKERRFRRTFLLYNSLTVGWIQMGVGHFSQGTSDRIRGNSLKLQQERFGLSNRENFISKRILQLWHRVPMAVVESLSLEEFKSCVDLTLGYMG